MRVLAWQKGNLAWSAPRLQPDRGPGTASSGHEQCRIVQQVFLDGKVRRAAGSERQGLGGYIGSGRKMHSYSYMHPSWGCGWCEMIGQETQQMNMEVTYSTSILFHLGLRLPVICLLLESLLDKAREMAAHASQGARLLRLRVGLLLRLAGGMGGAGISLTRISNGALAGLGRGCHSSVNISHDDDFPKVG